MPVVRVRGAHKQAAIFISSTTLIRRLFGNAEQAGELGERTPAEAVCVMTVGGQAVEDGAAFTPPSAE